MEFENISVNEKEIRFDDLAVGEGFAWDGRLCLKIENYYTDDRNINALELLDCGNKKSFCLISVPGYETVTRKKITLRVD